MQCFKAIFIFLTNISQVMKIIFLPISILVGLAMVACTSSEDDFSKQEQEQPNIELKRLYDSIDSLSNEYSTTDIARGSRLDKWGRRFLCGTVDACAGALTAGTGPVGAFFFSTVASGLYDDYLGHIMNKFEKQSRNSSRGVTQIENSVVFNPENANFVDSIGYYHNLILDEIRSKDTSFIDNNGNIDFNAYYNEVVAVSQKYGIYDTQTHNTSLIFKYIESIIKPFAQIEGGNQETYLSIIFNSTYNELNYDNAKTMQLRSICEKIIYNDLRINEQHTVEYGSKVNELIENSDIDNEAKNDLKIANNIAVNSTLYWNSNQ